jgi:hypothetical protein
MPHRHLPEESDTIELVVEPRPASPGWKITTPDGEHWPVKAIHIDLDMDVEDAKSDASALVHHTRVKPDHKHIQQYRVVKIRGIFAVKELEIVQDWSG